MNALLHSLQSPALLLARVIGGYLFLMHGVAKFFEYPLSMTGGNGSVALFSQYGLAGILEITGGVLLILGLFTRFTAFILSGQMAVAYLIAHVATQGNFFQPMLNEGELALLYSLFFLVLMFTGAGKFSLDAMRNRA